MLIRRKKNGGSRIRTTTGFFFQTFGDIMRRKESQRPLQDTRINRRPKIKIKIKIKDNSKQIMHSYIQ
jgi:hypothetical protein